jgi:hypothetical protein
MDSKLIWERFFIDLIVQPKFLPTFLSKEKGHEGLYK